MNPFSEMRQVEDVIPHKIFINLLCNTQFESLTRLKMYRQKVSIKYQTCIEKW